MLRSSPFPCPLPALPRRLSLWTHTETSFTFCRDSALEVGYLPGSSAGCGSSSESPVILLATPAREGRAVCVGALRRPEASAEAENAMWTFETLFVADRLLVDEVELDKGIDRRLHKIGKGEEGQGDAKAEDATEPTSARGDVTACALFQAPSGAALLLVGWDGGLVDLFDLPGMGTREKGNAASQNEHAAPSAALSAAPKTPGSSVRTAAPKRLLNALSTLRVQAQAPVLALAAQGATCVAVGASSRGAVFELGRPKKERADPPKDEKPAKTGLLAGAFQLRFPSAASDPAPPPLALRHPRPFRLPREGANDVALRSDGRVAVAACWDGVARAIDAETGETVGKLKQHADQVAAVRYSPSGRLLATAGGEGGIALWIASRDGYRDRLFLGAS